MFNLREIILQFFDTYLGLLTIVLHISKEQLAIRTNWQ